MYTFIIIVVLFFILLSTCLKRYNSASGFQFMLALALIISTTISSVYYAINRNSFETEKVVKTYKSELIKEVVNDTIQIEQLIAEGYSRYYLDDLKKEKVVLGKTTCVIVESEMYKTDSKWFLIITQEKSAKVTINLSKKDYELYTTIKNNVEKGKDTL